jgi:hypothetical protein
LLERPITFTVNLLGRGELASTTTTLPAQADILPTADRDPGLPYWRIEASRSVRDAGQRPPRRSCR